MTAEIEIMISLPAEKRFSLKISKYLFFSNRGLFENHIFRRLRKNLVDETHSSLVFWSEVVKI